MYTKGERVHYGAVGVCTVTDICRETIGGSTHDYYVLQPVFQPQTVIRVPADNPTLAARLHPVLSEEEIRRLIDEMPSIQAEWLEAEDVRGARLREAMRSGDRRQLVALIKGLYSQRRERAAGGRTLRAADAVRMKEAETLLYSEMALVLGIHPDEVLPMLKATLGEEAAAL